MGQDQDTRRPETGSIGWIDLTVDDAEQARDFYVEVVGWKHEPVDMGGYSDFNMKSPADGEPRAGVCHRRGGNAGQPSCWMIYINVDDLDRSIERCRALGGEVLAGPKGAGGHGRYCVIKDPAGAVAALFEPAG